MTESSPCARPALPDWLPLLQQPFEDRLGSKSSWSLRTAGGALVRVERGSQGLNNALYRVKVGGQVYACKLYVVDERRRAEREWAALRAVQNAGLGLAPEPLAFAPDGPLPQPAIVYRWVEGERLSASRPGDALPGQLVSALAQIHRTSPAPDAPGLAAWRQPANYDAYLAEIQDFWSQIQAGIQALQTAGGEPPLWARELPALLPLLRTAVEAAGTVVGHAPAGAAFPVQALVRVDGNLDNIVRRAQGALCFLDWEYSGWGDPAYDLAELRWHPSGLRIAPPHWDAALAAYTPHPDDVTFAGRLAVYTRLLPAWWVCRSALHLLEGAGLSGARRRLAPVPARLYRGVRDRLDYYLAALGLVEPPDEEEEADTG